MLRFKPIELGDKEILGRYIDGDGEFSCESAFINLFVWQESYKNMWATEDGQLIIKSGEGKDTVFRLPFGDDFHKGIELIREYTGEKYPKFWVQDGKRLDELEDFLGADYELCEERDAFDYVYLRENLATLSGKKYHGKRNHISAFSKQYNWEYRPITEENISNIKRCAELWYDENSYKSNRHMICEKNGIVTVLDNMKLLGAKGGAIYADGNAVAFTVGSPINGEVYDIHFEKALKQYDTAYSVINREFAKNELSDYKYINREDDLGLEGLRKAKLSYRPEMFVKKYTCIPKV